MGTDEHQCRLLHWVHIYHSQCQDSTLGRGGASRINILNSLFSYPLIFCWCLPLAKPNGKPVGKRILVGTHKVQPLSKGQKEKERPGEWT